MNFPSNSASILLLLTVVWGIQSSCCQGLGKFGFDVHHRYSDKVKGMLGLDGLPKKGSIDYHAAKVRRDQMINRGRHLAATDLTFSSGNTTYEVETLHYAYVTVGTPGLSFLVALDTGSDLAWLPCDCISSSTCYYNTTPQGPQAKEYNFYSPNTSSTSSVLPCSSPYCTALYEHQCTSAPVTCAYNYDYASYDTSTNGFMVQDILHLTPDDGQSGGVNASIPFGCGQNQTGIFLTDAAQNGLFGLGFSSLSVPGVLASEGFITNSFSMCFGADGLGRINFGDTGSSGQGTTPLSDQSNPFYDITVSDVTVGNDVLGVSFSAIFDSGTSFTYLNDPAYTTISEAFNSHVTETRFPLTSAEINQIGFEYCYTSTNQNGFSSPTLDLTMTGGDQFPVTDPTELVGQVTSETTVLYLYCLALSLTNGTNVIGQNFMTGYNIVFDRQNLVLGWEASNCYNAENSTTSTTSASSLSSTLSPHNIPEAFAGLIFIYLVYSALF